MRTKRDIAREYASKFPNHPLRAIARLLAKDLPDLFDFETARNHLNCITGTQKGKMKVTHSKRAEPGKRPSIPPIPESVATPWEPLVLKAKRILVLSDIHVPYHDGPALQAALKYGDSYKPDLVLLNGDIVDFHAISRYQKDPRCRSLSKEIEAIRQLLSHLKARYKARIIYKLGNHEERWWHYLWGKAPELLGCDFAEMAAVVEAEKNGVEMVDGQRRIFLGYLTVLHGHELPKGMTNPVNPARGAFLRSIDITLIGHQHRTSEHTETTMNGQTITCWSTGCLCELHPEYARINRWNHGFATVDLSGDDFKVTNKRIHHGKVL